MLNVSRASAETPQKSLYFREKFICGKNDRERCSVQQKCIDTIGYGYVSLSPIRDSINGNGIFPHIIYI